MKFSTQEEYGLRCLIRIGREYTKGKGVTIPEISEVEQLSQHNVAKILRALRLGGFLISERGQSGGYTLAMPPDKISIGNVLTNLGGKLFDDDFCNSHAGEGMICKNSIDCSVRSVWKIIQSAIDKVLADLTLKDLLVEEESVFERLSKDLENNSFQS